MIEAWVLWLFLVGLAVGVVATLVLVVRLPRSEGDVTEAERPAEAAWISSIIERYGGIAPRLLVEEVLGLHQAYLARGQVAAPGDPSRASTPAVPPTLPPGYRRVPPPPGATGPLPTGPASPGPVPRGPVPPGLPSEPPVSGPARQPPSPPGPVAPSGH